MELQKAIESRRSTRAFTGRKLTRAEIETLLRAATSAPSACNMQSWHFYIIADEGERAKLKGICADWVPSAPVVFIVCTDAEAINARFGRFGAKFPIQDTSLAIENLLLKATDMGLGGCIIGAYKQETLIKTFSIPDKYVPVALLPVGEPAEEIPARERKNISEVSEYIGTAPEEGGEPRAEEAEKPFELRHAYLPGAEFEDLNLSGASFENINLSGASFENINLLGAKFTDINLTGANYSALNMSGSHFECAELNGASFGCCEKCEREGKYCVEMQQALLDSVDMRTSKLNHCNLEGSVLTDVRAVGSKLYDIDLDESSLSGVNMVSSGIQCSNLFGASFKNCCFANTSLENCDIEGMTVDGISVAEAVKACKESAK